MNTQAWFLFAVVALVFFGISGITQKLSTNHVSFELSFLWFCIAMGVISATIAVAGPVEWRVSPSLVSLAALGGLLNGLGALTSFAALEKGGKASVVIPIINLYPLVTIAGAWLFLGEKLTATQVGGIVCALGAVVLLSQETAPGAGH
ncbi:MAG: DMT family transporter [Acidobacteriia bacterium]|nr:DMT family transporter [Terriglobia bacterium]